MSKSKKFNYLGERFTKSSFKAEFVLASLQEEDPKNVKWPREMKIMNQLAKKIPDPAFWDHSRPTFKLPSMAWYLTPKGRTYLNEKWREFNLKLKSNTEEQVKLEEEKVGEDLAEEPKKILTLKDFLKK